MPPIHRFAQTLPVLAVLSSSLLAAPQTTDLASVNSSATAAGNAASDHSSLSAAGRILAFVSRATNLAPGGTNGIAQIYARDLAAGTTQLASLASAGQADGTCDDPSVSGDGRYVLFRSAATNLDPGATTSLDRVFARDLAMGTTAHLSVSSAGTPGNGPALGRVRSSFDGQLVVFTSQASNLVASPATGPHSNVFLRNRTNSTTTLVSIDSNGLQGNAFSAQPEMSANGRYVVFESLASNLTTPPLATGFTQIFLRDLATSQTTMVSLTSSSVPANGNCSHPAISADGRYVAFKSSAINLGSTGNSGSPDVFRRDRVTGTTILVSQAVGGGPAGSLATSPVSLSADGRFVAFASASASIVLPDTNNSDDIFLRDTVANSTERMSIATSTAQANDASRHAWISADGRRVAFASRATNLDAFAANGFEDVYVRDRRLQCIVINVYCTAKLNSLGCTPGLAWNGCPSATNAGPFLVRATNVRNNKSGLLFYGVAGPNAAPFQGGFLCVAPQVRRTPAVSSGGTPPPANNCTGIYQLDFNAFAAGLLGGSPAAQLQVPGALVNCQWWGRDPGFPAPNNTALSAGLEFVIGP
jgi:Tol biopolymer transport system component